MVSLLIKRMMVISFKPCYLFASGRRDLQDLVCNITHVEVVLCCYCTLLWITFPHLRFASKYVQAYLCIEIFQPSLWWVTAVTFEAMKLGNRKVRSSISGLVSVVRFSFLPNGTSPFAKKMSGLKYLSHLWDTFRLSKFVLIVTDFVVDIFHLHIMGWSSLLKLAFRVNKRTSRPITPRILAASRWLSFLGRRFGWFALSPCPRHPHSHLSLSTCVFFSFLGGGFGK